MSNKTVGIIAIVIAWVVAILAIIKVGKSFADK